MNYNFAVELNSEVGRFTEFSDNLEELLSWLVDEEVHFSDTFVYGYYKLTPEGWEEIDQNYIDELAAPLIEEARARREQRKRTTPQKPYRVYFRGPTGRLEWDSAHSTQEEAEKAMGTLPAGLKPRIIHVQE